MEGLEKFREAFEARNDWDALSEPLAKALDQVPSFIEALLEQLDGLFAIEQS